MGESKLQNKILSFLESLAYPIALWNVLVLFFEPIIGYYLHVDSAQHWTAIGNLTYLLVIMLYRLFSTKYQDFKNRTIADGIILVFGSLLFIYDAIFVIFFLLIRQIFFIAKYLIFHAFEGAIYKRLIKNPPVTFLVSFAATILFGTILLMLPAATVSQKVTPFINALFTATSATCVTGLVVVDTGTYYSLFGQLVILALIQIGGLGIMTISTAFAVLLGQKLALRVENVMHNVMGEGLRFDLITLIKNVVMVTAIIEIAGALFLFNTFRHMYEPANALYYSVFHSISAFCNAGFSLYSDSFVRFVFNLNINAVITLMIIIGGLGFPVIVDVYYYLTKKSNRLSLSLHSKIVLSTTTFLLVFGTVMFFISEYYYTMEDIPIHRKLMSSWFQSVTCRTAGFNTIDQSGMNSSSSIISIVLMFIGASPGSTGGGIKTSTFALLILSIFALIKGQPDINVFKRRISMSSVRISTGLITISLMWVFIIVYLMLLYDNFSLEDTLFEAISAFGTVGLSRGITPYLSSASKLLITLLMYIGRVGPLTVLFALSQRKKTLHYSLAEEKITIG
jgi:trk system potassium uptake protein